MKRKNGRVTEAAERQETGCFIPSDALITGRTVLKESDFRVSQGPADPENAKDWKSSVPRVLCMLEPDQMVSFDAGAQPLLAPSGASVVVRITRKDKFLNAELRVHNIPVRRCLIAVLTDVQYGGNWVFTKDAISCIGTYGEKGWMVQLVETFGCFN